MDDSNKNDVAPILMPVAFVGHGSPLNAIEDNRWSHGFRDLAASFPRPEAILVISAHWYVPGTFLTGNPEPRTIHDFSGFPKPLYEVTYPAKGHVDLAKRVRDLVGREKASLNCDWGLDHGTWSVLKWMYPAADVPVIQLSIDRRLSERAHFEIGHSLRELRGDGVLILGSGNIVHNLRDAFSRMRNRDLQTPTWAREFDQDVASATSQHDTDALLTLASRTDSGKLAHPTPDHWVPLLYAAGASREDDSVRFTSEGFDWGSLSMRNIVWSP